MNTYERKQEARRQRLLDAADRAEAASMAAYRKADLREEVSGIPFGQPILVGHHSERRHRKAIERADAAMRASIEASKRAADLRGKAAGIGTAGISSDDPEAVEKLQADIEKAKRTHAFMVAANRIVRAAVKAGVDGPAHPEFAAYAERLAGAYGEGLKDAIPAKLLEPDFCGRVGFPDYALSNSTANIRRMEKRVAQLSAAREKAATSESPVTEYQGICTVVENLQENRLQIRFPDKPSGEVRAVLKGRGFRWAPSQDAWQRQLTNSARYALKGVLVALGVED